jgi:hypothetical protein
MRRDEYIGSGTMRYMNETRRGYPIRDDEADERDVRGRVA